MVSFTLVILCFVYCVEWDVKLYSLIRHPKTFPCANRLTLSDWVAARRGSQVVVWTVTLLPPSCINTTGASQPQLAGYNSSQQIVPVIQWIACSFLSRTCALTRFTCFVHILCEPAGTISRRSVGGTLQAVRRPTVNKGRTSVCC